MGKKPKRKSKRIHLPRDPLELSQLEPIARGQDRAVYFHSDYKHVLFKVLLTPDKMPARGFRGWSLRLFPSTRARAVFKEYQCAVQIQMRSGRRLGEIPISRLFGFIQTDIGPASIVERIHCGDRTIGPTHNELQQTGKFGSHLIELLNDLVARILSWQVRTTEMNMLNVVYGVRGGRGQFVLVDGIGDNFAIPIRTWSLTAMKKGQSESFVKIARNLDIGWNERAWSFEPRPA